LQNRFLKLAEEIVTSNPNILILNGDIFDKATPNFVEIYYFYKFIDIVYNNGIKIYVLAGNHEEIDKEHTTFDYLPEKNFTYIKQKAINLYSTTLLLVEHPLIHNILEYRKALVSTDTILVSHYRSRLKFADEEVDNKAISEVFDEIILSDIHYPYKPYSNISYTSSPYSTAFVQDSAFGFIELNIFPDKHTTTFKELKLPCLKLLVVDIYKLEELLLELDSQHLYKVRVLGQETALLKTMLGKNKQVLQYEFINDEEQDTNVVEELIKDIKPQLGVDFLSLIEGLLDNKIKTEAHLRLGRVCLQELF